MECLDCKKVVDVCGTSCLYCDKWIHITCIGLTEVYGSKALDNPYVHYMCPLCIPIVKNLIKIDHIKDIFNSTQSSPIPKPAPSVNLLTSSLSMHDTTSPPTSFASVSSPILHARTSSKSAPQTLLSLPPPLFSRPPPHFAHSNPPYVSPIFRTNPIDIKNRFNVLDPDLDLNKNVFSRNSGSISKSVSSNVSGKIKAKINKRKTDDSVNILVIGDSMSRNLPENLIKHSGKSSTGRPCPGEGVEGIVKKLRETNIEHDTLVIQVGTNDIGKLSEDDLKFKFRALLNDMRNRRNGAILVGILPRGTVYEDGKYTNNDAYYINNWLKKECKLRDIKFLDLWDKFFGNWSMYGRDGVHLSRRGKDILAKNVASLAFPFLR